MKELTPEQEDLIGDSSYHEKKLREEEEKEHKWIPIAQDVFNKILVGIGRKKQEVKK